MAEENYARLSEGGLGLLALAQCGHEAPRKGARGRPRKCCDTCTPKQEPRQVTQRQCPACRGFFVPNAKGGPEQKYCSRACAVRARTGSKPRQMWALRCVVCQSGFESLVERAVYCSNRCKARAWKVANPERAAAQYVRIVSAVYAGYCEECGAAFVARRKRRCCSDSCERKAWHRRHYISQAPTVRLCVCCGNHFAAPKAKTRPTDFCGTACRDKQKQRHKRTARARRKASERAAVVESVDPINVFERDGWKCQLCGVRTPKSKRGSYEPTAPELDHIIPLSQGGEHSYRNTQCACRRCNGLKSDRPMGQLLLIG